MAGIGFRIEKILAGDTYIDSVKAHFYSSIIFSGPWLVSILTLFLISSLSVRNLHNQQIVIFRSLIIYVYAFSLIVTGVLYLSASRYLADKLYQKDPEAFVPVFNSLCVLIMAIQSCLGWFFAGFLNVDMVTRFLAVMLYLTISLLWVVMIFLTALRDYGEITRAFVVGSVVAIAASFLLGNYFGLRGYLCGYFAGHLLIVILLSLRIFVEFGSRRIFDWEIFNFLLNNKTLIATGLCYNLAIWIDKIVFWYSPRAYTVLSFLHTFPDYESANFFAYLTIIPAFSIFLIQVETEFYRKYRLYYITILEKGTYSDIRKVKANMISTLRSSLLRIVVSQGLISLLAIFFAERLVGIFGFNYVIIPIFRICVLGAFLNCLLLIVILIMLYFDFKDIALKVTFIFAASNGFFTYVTSFMSLPYLGYGYALSALVSLACAYYMLDRKINRLEYLTFGLQPLGVHREEEIA